MTEAVEKKVLKEKRTALRLPQELYDRLMSRLSDNFSENVRQCIEKYLEKLDLSDGDSDLSDNGDQKDILSNLSSDIIDRLSDSFDEISGFVRQLQDNVMRISKTGFIKNCDKIIEKVNVVKWRFADRN